MPITQADGGQLKDVDELRYGLHSARPTNPEKGWIWISTDIKKFFACFADNVWTHINPVNITGAVDGHYFKYDGATGFLVPTPALIKVGLDDDKPEDPDVGDIYLATDTQIVYYCFEDDIWTSTYLPYDKLIEFELDDNEDLTLSGMNSIFERDGSMVNSFPLNLKL